MKPKLLHSRGNTHQNEEADVEWGKISASSFDKGLISTIYREIKKQNSKRTSNSITNGQLNGT
jgi:hypothetical protein